MFYEYDLYGWLVGIHEEEVPRSTQEIPESESLDRVVGELYPNFSGHMWMMLAYSEPVVYEPPPPEMKITKLALRNRFTRTEKITLELAAIDNPNGTLQQRQLAAALRADMKDQEAATWIDLDRDDTKAGIRGLEQYGLIAPGRADVILLTVPAPHEIPQ